MASFVKLESVKTSTHAVVGAAGATHSYSEEEKVAFSEHANQCLGSDPVLARHLPLDPSSDDLFSKVGDGLILCKLINLAVSKFNIFLIILYNIINLFIYIYIYR
jgi:hypothetical protein